MTTVTRRKLFTLGAAGVAVAAAGIMLPKLQKPYKPYRPTPSHMGSWPWAYVGDGKYNLTDEYFSFRAGVLGAPDRWDVRFQVGETHCQVGVDTLPHAPDEAIRTAKNEVSKHIGNTLRREFAKGAPYAEIYHPDLWVGKPFPKQGETYWSMKR